MSSESEERLERLELLVMMHEETLERFGELLRDQQKQLTALRDDMELLRDKLSKYESGEAPEDPHQPPPHY